MTVPITTRTGMFRGNSVAPQTEADVQGLLTLSATALATAKQASTDAATAYAAVQAAAPTVLSTAATAQASLAATIATANASMATSLALTTAQQASAYQANVQSSAHADAGYVFSANAGVSAGQANASAVAASNSAAAAAASVLAAARNATGGGGLALSAYAPIANPQFTGSTTTAAANVVKDTVAVLSSPADTGLSDTRTDSTGVAYRFVNDAQTVQNPWLACTRVGVVPGTATISAALAITGTSPHGPLFIHNDPPPTTIAGQSAGIQVIIGPDGRTTPGIGDSVAITSIVSNFNGRKNLWAADFACLQDPTGPDGYATALELEIASTKSFTPSPFNGQPSHTNLGMIAHGASTFNPTCAWFSWCPDRTGIAWHWNGGVMARVADVGLKFVKDPDPFVGVDAVKAFRTAAISDESDSAVTLKVTGTHNSIIDLSGATPTYALVKGSSTAPTNYLFTNNANF